MKTYLTCPYGGDDADPIFALEKTLACCGNKLGFLEIPIRAGEARDEEETLHLEIRALLSGLEAGDICLIQFPTGRDADFDRELLMQVQERCAHSIALVLRCDGIADCSVLRGAEQLAAGRPCIRTDLLAAGFAEQEIITAGIYPNITEYLAMSKLLNLVSPIAADFAPVSVPPDAIQAVLAIHDASGDYCRYAAAVMTSAMQCTRRNTVFHIILDESVSEANRRKLRQTARATGCGLVFHQVEEQKYRSLLSDANAKRYSAAALYRLDLVDILQGLNKVIYLDCDIFVHADLGELWDTDLRGNPVAACQDVGFRECRFQSMTNSSEVISWDEYYNTGVMIFDLSSLRRLDITYKNMIDSVQIFSNSALPDQNAINMLFMKHIRVLNENWNLFTRSERRAKHAILKNAIYHYAGEKIIPCDRLQIFDRAYLHILFNDLWAKDTLYQPWLNCIRMSHAHLIQLQKLGARAFMPGMRQIYYGDGISSMRNLITILHPQDGDFFISANPNSYRGTSLRSGTLDELSSLKKGSFFVIVLPEADQGTAMQKLDALGLQNGTDYFVAPMLVSSRQGGYLY